MWWLLWRFAIGIDTLRLSRPASAMSLPVSGGRDARIHASIRSACTLTMPRRSASSGQRRGQASRLPARIQTAAHRVGPTSTGNDTAAARRPGADDGGQAVWLTGGGRASAALGVRSKPSRRKRSGSSLGPPHAPVSCGRGDGRRSEPRADGAYGFARHLVRRPRTTRPADRRYGTRLASKPRAGPHYIHGSPINSCSDGSWFHEMLRCHTPNRPSSNFAGVLFSSHPAGISSVPPPVGPSHIR